MCDFRKSIESWLLERAVYEHAVMVAYEGEGDNADCLENAGIDEKRALQLTFRVRRNAVALRDDRYQDDQHADQRKCRGFRKLSHVSMPSTPCSRKPYLRNVSIQGKRIGNAEHEKLQAMQNLAHEQFQRAEEATAYRLRQENFVDMICREIRY